MLAVTSASACAHTVAHPSPVALSVRSVARLRRLLPSRANAQAISAQDYVWQSLLSALCAGRSPTSSRRRSARCMSELAVPTTAQAARHPMRR